MQEVKRTFILGEEWLYYKIYCGNYSADGVLIESILPIVVELQQKMLIDHWFFIRYNDPKNHLRLRFHLTDIKHIQEIIKIAYPYFRKQIEKDLLYDIETATYKRELERYGENTIEEVEKLFYYHSEKTLQLIDNTTPEEDEIARIFASLQLIDDLLECFDISLHTRQAFIYDMQLAHKDEHSIEKKNNKKLDLVYRTYRNDITLYLSQKLEPPYLEGLLEMIELKDEEIKIIKNILIEIEKNNAITILDLVASLIHMNINRTFRSKQRQYEMLCYDFMNRYYKSRMARK